MKILKIFGISVLVTLFGLLIYGGIITKEDVIVKRTSDYLYVKKYSLYNRDSTVYKYPATKIYQGVIQNKRKSSNFVGVPGKGGHYRTSYRTTVSYNNEYYTFTGSSMYHKYKKGDKVKVRVTHYPYYSIDIVN